MKIEKARQELIPLYKQIHPIISQRISEFRQKLERNDLLAIYKELLFCLLTPQSKAKTCWKAVEEIENRGLLFKAKEEKIKEAITGVRFPNNKARYIVAIQKQFASSGLDLNWIIEMKDDVPLLRDRLVKEIKGIGMKEASHFLRNIGLGQDIAILDRHILKNLLNYGVITHIPALSRKNYLSIENNMRIFSERINIPLEALDLLLWYKETGEVFK